jgi:excisionase family DNA binding protein
MNVKTYGTEELAELCGIHPETLRKEIRAGRLKAVTFGRVIRISAPEAAAWWAGRGGGQLFDGGAPAKTPDTDREL